MFSTLLFRINKKTGNNLNVQGVENSGPQMVI